MTGNVRLWFAVAALNTPPTADDLNNPDKYCRVFSCPAREMLSSSYAELAEELLQITNDPDWVGRGLRAMRFGDVFEIAGTAFVFVKVTGPATALACAMHAAATALEKWPGVAIVAIKQPTKSCQSKD